MNTDQTKLIVYHGTKSEEFDIFDPTKTRTARDIYAALEPEACEGYGHIILEFEVVGKIGDFRPDSRGLKEYADLKRAYEDELTDYWETFEEFEDAFDNGNMYQDFASSHPQDAFVDALCEQGYDALIIPDAGFSGFMSTSVVTQDPAVFKRTETPPLVFEKWKRCAERTFGDKSKLVRYEDPRTGGTIDIRQRPEGQPASVVEFYVPEDKRGQGGAQRLMKKTLEKHPSLMGQCSNRASATIAYHHGRRPVEHPDATLEQVFELIDEWSSVNLVTSDLTQSPTQDRKAQV